MHILTLQGHLRGWTETLAVTPYFSFRSRCWSLPISTYGVPMDSDINFEKVTSEVLPVITRCISARQRRNSIPAGAQPREISGLSWLRAGRNSKKGLSSLAGSRAKGDLSWKDS